jgi:hypothetical protein
VERCRKTLLILTPDYLESGWGEAENVMVQTLDPASRERRLIPLLVLQALGGFGKSALACHSMPFPNWKRA